LWTERGFEDGIEATTVAEIAGLAGVTKATFYLHFARKEDILNELGRATALAFDADAEAGMRKLQPTAVVLERVHTALATRVQSTDPTAVARVLVETRRHMLIVRGAVPHRFADTYERVVRYAQVRGDLSPSVDAREVARLLQAVIMDAMEQWATGELRSLRPAIVRRTLLVLNGAMASV
jgi:AcrR family transcriptional regulator